MCPIYDYLCGKCGLEYNVVKSIKEYDGKDPCVSCGGVGERIYTYCTFHHTGAKVEDAEFNIGLGRITKSSAHRKELAKQLGVEEVGNEKPETLHNQFDKAREEKRNKSWDEA